MFETIVTVEGEDFYNLREEKECYKLVRESTNFLYNKLEELSIYESEKANVELNGHMRKMFKNMKKSLTEEIGSVSKDFLLWKYEISYLLFSFLSRYFEKYVNDAWDDADVGEDEEREEKK